MISRWRFILLAVVILTAAGFVHLREGVATPQARPLSEFPTRQGAWRSTGEHEFDAAVLDLLRPTDYLSRTYTHPELGTVQLYIGYHDGGPESGPIHSPRNCLPGSGWEEFWRKIEVVDVPGRPLEVTGALFGKEKEKIYLLYWFQTQGRQFRSEYGFKAASVLNALLRNRSDQAFIRITVLDNPDSPMAPERARAFARDFSPLIDEFLPH